jgi:hypothetical protein
MPNPSVRDGRPQITDEFLGMMTSIYLQRPAYLLVRLFG